MPDLSDTILPEPIVKALRKNKITTVDQLFSKTGAEIRYMMPGYYTQINQFICAYEPPRQIKKKNSRQGQMPLVPLTDFDVLSIRKYYSKGAKIAELCNEFSASKGIISRIVKEETYRHLL